jgi:hypothetical protein
MQKYCEKMTGLYSLILVKFGISNQWLNQVVCIYHSGDPEKFNSK